MSRDPWWAPLDDVRLTPTERTWLGVDVVTDQGPGQVVGLAPGSRNTVWVSDGVRCWAVKVADLELAGPAQDTLL